MHNAQKASEEDVWHIEYMPLMLQLKWEAWLGLVV